MEVDNEDCNFICGRCKLVFSSPYGERDAFCPNCGQHSKTKFIPNNDRDFSHEWPSSKSSEAPEHWPDGTKNQFYRAKKDKDIH